MRRLLSRSINRLVSKITKMSVRDLGCSLKAFRREAAHHLMACTHSCRYIPAETAWHGLMLGEVEVEHRERSQGESKYGALALFRVSFDMIASISTLPIRAVAPLGIIFACLGFLISLRVVYFRIVHGDVSYMGAIMAALFVLTGVQMFTTAIMCEYISRIYTEVQRRPYYLIRDVLQKEPE